MGTANIQGVNSGVGAAQSPDQKSTDILDENEMSFLDEDEACKEDKHTAFRLEHNAVKNEEVSVLTVKEIKAAVLATRVEIIDEGALVEALITASKDKEQFHKELSYFDQYRHPDEVDIKFVSSHFLLTTRCRNNKPYLSSWRPSLIRWQKLLTLYCKSA